MSKAIISLGSNLGDSISILQEAIVKINNQIGGVVSASSFYQTKPWGFEAENDFVNAVIIVDSTEHGEMLMQDLLNLEEEFGRKRNNRVGYSSRTLDLDIIAIDDIVHTSETLTIPHPEAHKRLFVLMPLQEVMPNWVHPLTKQGVMELINSLPDGGDIIKLEQN